MSNDEKIIAPKPKSGDPWDVAIVGSGPSGLTAAIYTTRGAASTVILGGSKWGGQLMLTTEIDNFPAHPGIQGPELMAKMREHAVMFGAEFVEKDVVEVDFSQEDLYKLKTDEKEYLARSVIIATGSDTRWLGIPGEDKLRGRGVSSCAPCDAPFFKDKKVVVIGGGDSAMEEALVLTKYASSVIIVYRGNQLRASKAMQKRVFSNGKIKVVWDTQPVEFVGENKLEAIVLKTDKKSKYVAETKDKAISEYKGNISEENDGFFVWSMSTDGAFVAIGHIPMTKIFKGKVELDEKGYVVSHHGPSTNLEGVFVAGDVNDYHYKQAITAAGFGCQAGMDCLKFLDKE